ncbi:HK97 gp10 family phage protein [Pseudomonas lactis]|uniref:HK97 gp10 family phage protein n=1 Tax=Pseudomonas lactis TaxID=1615674 RepID=UPI002898D2F4|nr:HK97 gp10 family phage protein [Pseudomonas lactis]
MSRQRGGRAWSTPPSVFSGVIREAIVERHRAIVLAMMGEIVLRAPVDTGRFLANNIVSIGSPVYYSLDEYDKTGRETISRAESALSGLQPFTVTYIQNNLVYAGPLEDGHSRQAPAGIYGIAFYGVTQAYTK